MTSICYYFICVFYLDVLIIVYFSARTYIRYVCIIRHFKMEKKNP